MDTASCQVCEKGKAEGIKLSFCKSCRSVSYCSRECQKEDWKTHKVICKELNVGDAKQIVSSGQRSRAKRMEELAKLALSDCDNPRARRFFDLFFKSQGDTDHTDTVRKMKNILLKECRYNREVTMFRSLNLLSQLPSEMLKLPTSPLKVSLQSVDASAMSSPGPNMDDGKGCTPLHCLAEMSNPSKDHVLENQCILAMQLIGAGANVNARAQRNLFKMTPLHVACFSGYCTNLDYIQLLLDHGANPNAKDSKGATPLQYTLPAAPGAAKCLLTYSDKTDPDIDMNDGRSFLFMVRCAIAECTSEARLPNNLEKERLLFVLKQWEEVETLLIERGALDSALRG
jgi:hypothetical protein